MDCLPRLALVAAMLSTSTALHAQNTAAGKWIAEFEVGMRNVNGEVSSTGTGRARMTLELRGDSVFGTWEVLDPAPPAGAATRPLKGTIANGVLKLETEVAERRIMMNETEQRIKMVTRYELTIQGDSISGTVRQVALGGEIEPPSRPFKAVREKS